MRERLGGYPVDPEHEPHLVGAIEWLIRAHDATADGGISQGSPCCAAAPMRGCAARILTLGRTGP